MPASLYSLTFDEFVVMLEGRRKVDEAKMHDDWERTRWLAMALLQVHLKKGKRLKASDLITFPWEGKTIASKVITPEVRKAMFEKARKELKKTPVKSEPLKMTSAGKIVDDGKVR
jgi:Flp pilus assembly protein CpaB